MRKTIGARELKMRLGTYLRQVQEGTTIVVTERGRPVAELRPVPLGKTEEEARLDELAALGALQRGTGGPLKPLTPIQVAGRPLSETLLDDREDRL
ncbi:MAG TPA: type II toxin-antitoxin system prevent-host-death family antitoxin [Thermoanaerobaculia bacterium]|nr:type II toxin-antitoxin system prevent-host-death family antitoxin [Thermoanaerobaculia bacterium]